MQHELLENYTRLCDLALCLSSESCNRSQTTHVDDPVQLMKNQ